MKLKIDVILSGEVEIDPEDFRDALGLKEGAEITPQDLTSFVQREIMDSSEVELIDGIEVGIAEATVSVIREGKGEGKGQAKVE